MWPIVRCASNIWINVVQEEMEMVRKTEMASEMEMEIERGETEIAERNGDKEIKECTI
jgi:hypothetical protein